MPQCPRTKSNKCFGEVFRLLCHKQFQIYLYIHILDFQIYLHLFLIKYYKMLMHMERFVFLSPNRFLLFLYDFCPILIFQNNSLTRILPLLSLLLILTIMNIFSLGLALGQRFVLNCLLIF